VKVEIFSDLVCPWCFIGKRRFERAVESLRADGLAHDLEVVVRPYQLDPTAPTNETTPVAIAYAKKFGGPEKADAILRHVTEVAAADGITFNMDVALRANTLAAHRLLAYVEVRDSRRMRNPRRHRDARVGCVSRRRRRVARRCGGQWHHRRSDLHHR